MDNLTESQRHMAEALPCMLWTATPNGNVDYVNRVFEHYTGDPAEQPDMIDWLNVIHPDDRESARQRWAESIASGRPHQTEVRLFHKASNSYRWHYVAASPHRDSKGNIHRWYGITTDIQDTKLAQTAVDQAHRNLQRMLALQSLEARVLDMISAERPLPLILDEITHTVDSIIPQVSSSILLVQDNQLMHGSAPKLPSEYNRLVNGLAIGEGVGSCGTTAARKQVVIVSDMRTDPLWAPYGHLVDILGMRACWSTPIIDSQDQVLATFGLYYPSPCVPTKEDHALIERFCQFVRIAIERTRLRDNARADEERFRAIAQASSDVIWEYDLATDAMTYSDGMLRLFGHDPATDPYLASGALASHYIHDDDREAVVARMAEATNQGKNWKVDYRYQRADGSYAHVVNRAIVLVNAGNKPHRVVGSITDTTEQKQLEEQLRRSQRLEAVGQLTGGIAHDFNNLLTIILGNADQLAEELPASTEHQELAEDIKAAARRGADLIRSLLSFSRQQVLHAKPVRLTDLIQGTHILLQRALGTHRSLVLDFPEQPWATFLDAGQFENALLNLVLNARDAMPSSGTLTLRLRNTPLTTAPSFDGALPAGDYVILEVQDTGTGMDENTLKHAFDPFFTTKELGKGSGLGLSMVYGFVKQSNGYVAIESSPGKGTTVRVYFPRHLDAAGHDPLRTTPGVTKASGAETILIVEDEPVVQQFLVTQLKHLGYAVVAAENGDDALEILEETPNVKLLFTDMMMPGSLDGYELAQRARELKPDIGVILSSGYSDKIGPSDAQTPEGYWVLAKPYMRSDLAAKVRQALA
jgi:PAS domain S-box-containing protein